MPNPPPQPRSTQVDSTYFPRSTHDICLNLDSSKLLISRTTLIAAIAVCVIVTCISTLALSVLLYREWTRRRENQKKRTTRSHENETASQCNDRGSSMHKESDEQFLRRGNGCLSQDPENPFVERGGMVPVELMNPERLCEVPATPPPRLQQKVEKAPRKSQGGSLFFDQASGMWIPQK